MKNLLFIMILVGVNFNASSQVAPENKTRFGFILGLNQTNLRFTSQTDSLNIENGLGFNLGVLIDYQLSDHFYVSPKAEIGFYNGKVTRLNELNYFYSLTPTVVDFSLNIRYSLNESNKGLYFYLGPKVQFPIKNNNEVTTVFGFPLNYTLDIGTGFNIKLRKFDLSPEIRYSFALQPINVNPAIPLVKFNSFSMLFNLLG